MVQLGSYGLVLAFVGSCDHVDSRSSAQILDGEAKESSSERHGDRDSRATEGGASFASFQSALSPDAHEIFARLPDVIGALALGEQSLRDMEERFVGVPLTSLVVAQEIPRGSIWSSLRDELRGLSSGDLEAAESFDEPLRMEAVVLTGEFFTAVQACAESEIGKSNHGTCALEITLDGVRVPNASGPVAERHGWTRSAFCDAGEVEVSAHFHTSRYPGLDVLYVQLAALREQRLEQVRNFLR